MWRIAVQSRIQSEIRTAEMEEKDKDKVKDEDKVKEWQAADS